MEKKSEYAIAQFHNGFNCAQSVLSAFANELNMGEEQLLKIACGFGAGMGRNEEVCGAVSGGIMVIGLKYGKSVCEDNGAMDKTYQLTRSLMKRMREKHGTYLCKVLLNGCDLKTEQGQKEFREKDMKTNICIPCIRSAIDFLEKETA